ncbi:MAG: metallophosphoesterase family protein [Chloroflexi bacterium]|nr:metallophosphoesterase family protein [Chloroflexota bacterium]
MRVLVVSDIHSNLSALDAVLADAPAYDQIWSLGDIVGYGPQPCECIARLSEYEHQRIPGNHDWGAIGKISLDVFNKQAAKAALWTREQLSASDMAYLGELDEVLELEGVTLAHGSPRAPIWEYVVRADIAMENMAAFSTRLCLVGHSHVPVAYWQQHAGRNCIGLQLPEGEPFSYAEGRSLINPGSVGQPRDADPRASYLVLDTSAETVEHRRVAYDIGATQTLMRSRKLFGRNIDRLEYGI